MTDFDQLYKRLIKNFFKWFLEFFCDEIAREIDFTTEPQFIDKELYTDQVHGKKRYTDILAKVKMLKGNWTYILIHIEIQREREIDFSRRMFNYYKAISMEYNEAVFALAIYIGEDSSKEGLDNVFEEQCFGTRVRYEYEVRNLQDYDYRDYLDHDNPIIAALLVQMDHGSDSGGMVMAVALKKLSEYKLNEKDRVVIIDFIERILKLNEEEVVKFNKYLGTEEYKEVMAMISGYKEIIEEYKEEGKIEGKIEGERSLLIRLIKSKWGALPPDIKERLYKINTSEELEALGEKVIVCECIEDWAKLVLVKTEKN